MEKLQKLIENNPDDPFPCYGLAMELRGLNLASKAAGVFSELLQRRPNYVAAYLQYAAVLIDLGDEDKARRVLNKGMEVSSSEGDQHAFEELQAALRQLS